MDFHKHVQQFLSMHPELQAALNTAYPTSPFAKPAEPPPAETWEQQKTREARAYLEQQRSSEKTLATGAEPFHYLPTVEGEIAGGRLAWSDLTTDELMWVYNEQREFYFKAVNFPGGDEGEVKKTKATIAAVADELAKHGINVAKF